MAAIAFEVQDRINNVFQKPWSGGVFMAGISGHDRPRSRVAAGMANANGGAISSSPLLPWRLCGIETWCVMSIPPQRLFFSKIRRLGGAECSPKPARGDKTALFVGARFIAPVLSRDHGNEGRNELRPYELWIDGYPRRRQCPWLD